MTTSPLPRMLLMGFGARLAQWRKERGLTQLALAEKAELHVVQVRRYETEVSQPSLEAIRKLALALSISTDALLFDDDERGPDDDLRLQFEAVSRLPAAQKKIIKALIEGMIFKHEAQRMLGSLGG